MKHRKIMHWDDERKFGNGFMITTAYGWAFDPDHDENSATHIRGFDSAKDARAQLKWIAPCTCQRCQRKSGG